MALTREECDSLMRCINNRNMRVFYTRSEIEFGFTGEA
jgi:hypothetical protein